MEESGQLNVMSKFAKVKTTQLLFRISNGDTHTERPAVQYTSPSRWSSEDIFLNAISVPMAAATEVPERKNITSTLWKSLSKQLPASFVITTVHKVKATFMWERYGRL